MLGHVIVKPGKRVKTAPALRTSRSIEKGFKWILFAPRAWSVRQVKEVVLNGIGPDASEDDLGLFQIQGYLPLTAVLGYRL